MRKVSTPKVAESGVLRACLDLLAAEKIWHLRMNTGAMKVGKRFTRFGRPGTADILATAFTLDAWETIAWFIWIECKSDSGRQTDEQKQFQAEVEKAGHHYLLVRDVDTLRNWLKAKGVTL